MELHHIGGLLVEVHAGDALAVVLQVQHIAVVAVVEDGGGPPVVGQGGGDIAVHLLEGAHEVLAVGGVRLHVVGVVGDLLIHQVDHVLDIAALGGIAVDVGLLGVQKAHRGLAPALGDGDILGVNICRIVPCAVVAEQHPAVIVVILILDDRAVIQKVLTQLAVNLYIRDRDFCSRIGRIR